MNKISVVINTLNEEKNLPRALESIKHLTSEIVVVDMHSEDKTQEVARKFGAKIYEYKRTNCVEPARNFAISKATNDWILILDADEELPKGLPKLLIKIIEKPLADYYRIPRKNIIFGKWLKHSRWWPDFNIRFFKKGCVEWSEVIHSVPITKGVGVDLPEKENSAIIHHHYETIEQYLERMNKYTGEYSKNLITNGYKFKWQDLIKKPISEFLSRFYFGEGYKDGIHGLALSLLQAFSEVVVYLKIWQSNKFEKLDPNLKEVAEVIKKSQREVNYWQADSLIKNGGGLITRIKRRFKLP